MMKLPPEEIAFLKRVRGYCERGLTEKRMADEEEKSLTALRTHLNQVGFRVEKTMHREVVRTGSGETLSELIATGLLVTAQPAEVGPAQPAGREEVAA